MSSFNLDSVNNSVVHCTNQFETDILANDFAINNAGYGAYSWSADGSTFVGSTAHATHQTGVSYGTTTGTTTGLQFRRIFKLAVGKYERIKYKFDILNTANHADVDFAFGIQVPASSSIIQDVKYTTAVGVTGGTDSDASAVNNAVVEIANAAGIPNGTWIKVNPDAASDAARMVLTQGANGGPGHTKVTGVLEASSTAGELSFWFRQAASAATPTVAHAGSTFQYLKF
jgi:hypothetical protein